jgi:hypothetical protein
MSFWSRGKKPTWERKSKVVHGLDDLLDMPPEMIEFFSDHNDDKSSATQPLTFKPVRKGERNTTLARLVGKWVNQGINMETANLAAIGWNSRLDEPLNEKEVENVVKSIFNTDRRNHPERQESKKATSPIKDPQASLSFPFQVMKGPAGYFARVYGNCMEAPQHFLFISYLICLGAYFAPKLTIQSLLKTQPRIYGVLIGESASERKSTTLNKVVMHFLSAFKDFNVCWGITTNPKSVVNHGRPKAR